ncbi:MAG: hypothetical protein NVSMB44_37480 [Ktedonobacteraceae bacterium]
MGTLSNRGRVKLFLKWAGSPRHSIYSTILMMSTIADAFKTNSIAERDGTVLLDMSFMVSVVSYVNAITRVRRISWVR